MQEKRREQRRPASGSVRVRFRNPEPLEVDGKLLDLSVAGFRMSHDCTSLATGITVDFRHSRQKGQAKVMWNRILASGIETGFLVL